MIRTYLITSRTHTHSHLYYRRAIWNVNVFGTSSRSVIMQIWWQPAGIGT